ncbi:hypothetical protein ACSTIN_12910 [Vibrio parahaemolyticus]
MNKTNHKHMTPEFSREMQRKSARTRSINALKRNEIKNMLTNSTIEELLEKYKLDTNLTLEQRNAIQQHVMSLMISTKYAEELKHKHAVERILIKNELDELSAEHVAALRQESNQIDDTFSEELGLSL